MNDINHTINTHVMCPVHPQNICKWNDDDAIRKIIWTSLSGDVIPKIFAVDRSTFDALFNCYIIYNIDDKLL